MSGRKVEAVVVPKWENNRDAGKTYVITEMSSASAEKWALRMFLLLKGSEERIPNVEELRSMGMVGVAIVGLNVFLQASIDPGALEPLMDEMMTCVGMIRDTQTALVTPIVSDDDIEEVQTRLWLRSEILRVHTGFSVAESLSKLISVVHSAAT